MEERQFLLQAEGYRFNLLVLPGFGLPLLYRIACIWHVFPFYVVNGLLSKGYAPV